MAEIKTALMSGLALLGLPHHKDRRPAGRRQYAGRQARLRLRKRGETAGQQSCVRACGERWR